MKKFKVRFQIIIPIVIFFLMLGMGNLSIAQEEFESYLTNNELYEKAKDAYKNGRFKDAGLFFYAYMQRHKAIFDNPRKQDHRDLLDALKYCLDNVVVGAVSAGDSPEGEGLFYPITDQIIKNRPGIPPDPPIVVEDRIDNPPINNARIAIDSSGKEYKTIQVGGATWLAENMAYSLPGSWCYGNALGNCRHFGRLYTWEKAVKACQSLGPGWRLPSKSDWENLLDAYGGLFSEEALRVLTVGGRSGFNAGLGGQKDPDRFRDINKYAHYWTSTTEQNGNSGKVAYAFFPDPGNKRWGSNIWGLDWGQYCRCVKD